MQYLFYVIIFVAVVSVATALVNSMLFPFVAIKESELPTTIRQAISKYFPALILDAVKLQRARQRFLIDGKLGKRQVQIIFVLTPEQEIYSVELTEKSGESFVARGAIEHSQVPPHIASCFHPFLASDQTPFHSRKAVAGQIGNQEAYLVEFDTTKYQYRFEAGDNGRLTGFLRKSIS